MTVRRISNAALEVILGGRTRQAAECVIKFYSNNCHFCRELKNDYAEISDMFEDVNFFAFNADEHPFLDKLIDINGVPSIAFVQTGASPYISVLSDPKDTHSLTWYHKQDIINFIKKELR
tara:strand:+ start:571 stop:930 length:360 start_codon:yes stop_codon:yes gene_type:complete